MDNKRKTQNYVIRAILFQSIRECSLSSYQTLQIFLVKHNFAFKVLRTFIERSGDNRTERLFEHSYRTGRVNNLLFKRPKINNTVFSVVFFS